MRPPAEERLGAPRGNGRQVGTVRGIRAVRADDEPFGLDAGRAQLERRPIRHVAGEQSEYDRGLRLESLEQDGDAGHQRRLAPGVPELLFQQSDVAAAEYLHVPFRGIVTPR